MYDEGPQCLTASARTTYTTSSSSAAAPAGLYTGLLLARRGFDVALFEEHATPGEPVHCTGVLAADAYDELEIPRAAILNSLSHVSFFAPSGRVVDYTTPTVEALVVDRRRVRPSPARAGARAPAFA